MARHDQIFRDGFPVTPSDSVDLPERADGIYVGSAGDVKILTEGGNPLTFTGVPAGGLVPCSALRVYSTGTSASSITAVMYEPRYISHNADREIYTDAAVLVYADDNTALYV